MPFIILKFIIQMKDGEKLLISEYLCILQLADELLADAHSAHEKAEEAVRLGDKTLREANETLITLKGERTSSKKEMGEWVTNLFWIIHNHNLITTF